MYNTLLLPQGTKHAEAATQIKAGTYFPPDSIKMLKCYEDTNGEFVPKPNQLETRANSQ